MTPNPILEEIYAAREKLLADAGGDLRKHLQGVREREAASGRLLAPKLQPIMPIANAEQQRSSQSGAQSTMSGSC